jgi:hypothetical protein
MKKPPDVSVQDFLKGFDPPLRQLAQSARERISSGVPHATERVRIGWGLIGYNAPAYVAFISFQRDHIRIGFEWGVMLANHSDLLEGSGSQVRHVTIRSAADLKHASLPALLVSAAAIVPPSRIRG